jgi:hypothetical protein
MKTIEEIKTEMKGIIGAYPIDDIFDEDRCINELLSIEVGGEVVELEDKYDECNGRKLSRPRTVRDCLEEKI